MTATADNRRWLRHETVRVIGETTLATIRGAANERTGGGPGRYCDTCTCPVVFTPML